VTTWRAERTHFWCEDCTRWLTVLNQPDHEIVHQSTPPVDGGPAPTGTPLPVGATLATDSLAVVEPGSEPPASGGGSSRPH
jgi:hypothetical protein